MSEKSYGNELLHKVLLSAMKDFDELCRKNNLKYCLHGGTLLGAIRHKGFIPWDDDVDIIMLRNDYDRFIRIAQNDINFSKKYFLQNVWTEPNMITNMTKIRINNTYFDNENDNCDHRGAFLDIFPMNAVPNSNFMQKLQKNIMIFLNLIVYAKLNYIELGSIKAKIILGTLSKLNRNFLSKTIEYIMKHFPHYNSNYVNIVCTANYNGNKGYEMDLWPKCYFEETEEVVFCESKFFITKHWKEYLTRMYGDYMSLPPESKRNNKHGLNNIQVLNDGG